jgi:hypothetical protein
MKMCRLFTTIKKVPIKVDPAAPHIPQDTIVTSLFKIVFNGNSTKHTEEPILFINLCKNKTMKPSKPSSSLVKPGEILYKKALENRRKKERIIEGLFQEERQKKTPQITGLAMMIHRDPSKTFERLYPSHIVQEKQKRKVKKNIFYEFEMEDPLTQRVYRKKREKVSEKMFSFTPEIDEKSKKLVQNKGTFFKRLEKSKGEKENKSNDNLVEKSFSTQNLNDSYMESPSKTFFLKILKKLEQDNEKEKKKSKMNNIFTERTKLIIKLKQEEHKIKKELFFTNRGNNEKIDEEKENFWKKYNKNQTELKKKYSPHTFYDKQEIWKKNVNKRKEKLKEIISVRDKEICTFKPELRSLEIRDDEVFINKNLNQIIEYVSRRKKCIEKDMIKNENSERKYSSKERFVFKPTIPKAFQLGKERISNTPMTDRGSRKNGGKIRNLSLEIQEFFGFDGTL